MHNITPRDTVNDTKGIKSRKRLLTVSVNCVILEEIQSKAGCKRQTLITDTLIVGAMGVSFFMRITTY